MINPSQIPFAGHNKLSVLLGEFHDQIGALLAGLFDFEVPEGYEDETGFHYALAPVRSASRPPMDSPTWLGEDI